MTATVIISLLLAALVAAILIKLWRDKQAGRCTCSHGCSGCASAGLCHSREKEEQKKK